METNTCVLFRQFYRATVAIILVWVLFVCSTMSATPRIDVRANNELVRAITDRHYETWLNSHDGVRRNLEDVLLIVLKCKEDDLPSEVQAAFHRFSARIEKSYGAEGFIQFYSDYEGFKFNAAANDMSQADANEIRRDVRENPDRLKKPKAN